MSKLFEKLGNVDVSGIRVADIPRSTWYRDTWRQSYTGTAHKDTATIYLRMCKILDRDSLFNDLEVEPCYNVINHLFDVCPAIPASVQQVMQEVKNVVQSLHGTCKLGRAMLVKLEAGGIVLPHTDEGAYARHYNRLHIPISTEEGNLLMCDNERRYMRVGEVWQFNHRTTHSAVNNSGKDRVHLIMDYV